jgi:hypothetical protein
LINTNDRKRDGQDRFRIYVSKSHIRQPCNGRAPHATVGDVGSGPDLKMWKDSTDNVHSSTASESNLSCFLNPNQRPTKQHRDRCATDANQQHSGSAGGSWNRCLWAEDLTWNGQRDASDPYAKQTFTRERAECGSRQQRDPAGQVKAGIMCTVQRGGGHRPSWREGSQF